MEVNAYRAEPDPVGYSSADNQDEEEEQVTSTFRFSFMSSAGFFDGKS